MPNSASPIKDILENVVSKISGDRKKAVDKIEEAWKAAVDKKTYTHTKLAGLKGKRLVVNVNSSAWMYEVNLHKHEIKERLNKYIKEEKQKIEEIVLRIGDIG